MSTQDWRDTSKWSRDVNGYTICPCCGAMIHGRCVDLHADTCYAIKKCMGDIVEVKAGRAHLPADEASDE